VFELVVFVLIKRGCFLRLSTHLKITKYYNHTLIVYPISRNRLGLLFIYLFRVAYAKVYLYVHSVDVNLAPSHSWSWSQFRL